VLAPDKSHGQGIAVRRIGGGVAVRARGALIILRASGAEVRHGARSPHDRDAVVAVIRESFGPGYAIRLVRPARDDIAPPPVALSEASDDVFPDEGALGTAPPVTSPDDDDDMGPGF